MNIRELTRKAPAVLAPDATIAEAADMMDRQAVGSVVVIDGGRPVGIVTDRDLVVRALARRLPADARVDAVMTPGVVCVDADADVTAAVALFGSHPFRRLPVVDGHRMIGMISLDDLVVRFTQELSDLTRGMTAQLLFGHPEPRPPAVIDTGDVE